jgi:hypothetical protein
MSHRNGASKIKSKKQLLEAKRPFNFLRFGNPNKLPS